MIELDDYEIKLLEEMKARLRKRAGLPDDAELSTFIEPKQENIMTVTTKMIEGLIGEK